MVLVIVIERLINKNKSGNIIQIMVISCLIHHLYYHISSIFLFHLDQLQHLITN